MFSLRIWPCSERQSNFKASGCSRVKKCRPMPDICAFADIIACLSCTEALANASRNTTKHFLIVWMFFRISSTSGDRKDSEMLSALSSDSIIVTNGE
mmetsp:Transcript_7637/g.9470  ORF Transcript_7637/g.9470 Transcript_7637/m.9470 type:complete len:97 (-) Transcript_7637:420-710(-)